MGLIITDDKKNKTNFSVYIEKFYTLNKFIGHIHKHTDPH